MSDRNAIIAAFAAGAVAGAAIFSAYQGFVAKQRLPKHKNVYVLVVRLKLKKDGLEQFKQLWSKLADHCRLHEPNTLSYEALTMTDDDTEIMIYERCEWLSRRS